MVGGGDGRGGGGGAVGFGGGWIDSISHVFYFLECWDMFDNVIGVCVT